MDTPSLLIPTFLAQLAAPEIKTVLLCGCGGGFDFVHSLILYPGLRQLGKTVIIGSYSFGEPENIGGQAPVVFKDGKALVKQVTAQSIPNEYYCPEVHVCSFLDQHYPATAPHFTYAYYARAFSIAVLGNFYRQLIEEHSVDAVVLFDGGSDSLMRGDEDGLGDPVEDAVSVATVAGLKTPALKLLVSVGMGSDRYNHVSDAATLRAVAELTAQGGFRGAVSLEPDYVGIQFYRDCVAHIYANQQFKSTITGMILSAAEGYFGGAVVPPHLPQRLATEKFFIWPLMAMLWAFDVEKVAARSLMLDWIRDCTRQQEALVQIHLKRHELGIIRAIENLPCHEEMRSKEQ